jgi:hypothetical protein
MQSYQLLHLKTLTTRSVARDTEPWLSEKVLQYCMQRHGMKNPRFKHRNFDAYSINKLGVGRKMSFSRANMASAVSSCSVPSRSLFLRGISL